MIEFPISNSVIINSTDLNSLIYHSDIIIGMFSSLSIFTESTKLPRRNKESDKLEEMFPGRKTNPSRVYIPRCEHFLENPPESDWDGVWTLTSK